MGITLDYISKIVSITNPTTEVTVQELVNTIRESEDELLNMSYDKVIDAVGKADLGSSVYTAVTLTLSSLWQIQFWNGVTLGTIKSGNIVGGVGGEPVKATGGADTIIILNQVGGTISTTGSGVTEQDKTDIIDGVWDEATTNHTTAGTTGLQIDSLPSGMKRGEAVSGFSFLMVDNNGNDSAGKTVTVSLSKDGGAFISLGTATEISNGFYYIDFTSDNMDANTIAIIANANLCKQTAISVVTS